MNNSEVNENKINPAQTDEHSLTSTPAKNSQMALVVGSDLLDQEAVNLINQLIVETDANKTKDLTQLFNAVQNKKALIRTSKYGELLDLLMEQALIRFRNRPDEISNQELLSFLKTLQDMVERSQKQANGADSAPLIQINQQTNNLGGSVPKTKESRENLQRVIQDILQDLAPNQAQNADVVDFTSEAKKDE